MAEVAEVAVVVMMMLTMMIMLMLMMLLPGDAEDVDQAIVVHCRRRRAASAEEIAIPVNSCDNWRQRTNAG